jgi:hypothetical protein
MINFITENYEWFFSGLGVFILGFFVYRKAKSKHQQQTVSENSQAMQAGRDINITRKGK